jgi:hypothetical protein
MHEADWFDRSASFAACRAKHDHSSKRRKARQAPLVRLGSAEHFQDDVDPFFDFGANTRRKIVLPIIDDEIRAKGPHEIGLLGRSDGTCYERSAHTFCELHRERTDASRGRMHEDFFAALQSTGQRQDVVRRETLDGKSCGILEGQTVWNGENAASIGNHAFGISRCSKGDDTIARAQVRDAIANGGDDAGRFHARNGGELGLNEVLPPREHRIGVIQAHGADVDEDLAWFELRLGGVFDVEDFGSAERMEADGAHDRRHYALGCRNVASASYLETSKLGAIYVPYCTCRCAIVPFVRDPEDLRKFARQDWALAKRTKEDYWLAFKKRFGAAGAMSMVDELRNQILAQKKGWPSEEERREDYATHLRVIDALERVSRRRRAASG